MIRNNLFACLNFLRFRLIGCFYRMLVVFFILLGTWTCAQANMDQELNHFFNSLGYQSNVTKPTAYQDQAAGYYSGGSVFLRNQVRNFQLMSVELPSFSGGCSGIDSFLGSFSIIGADEALQMIKNILSSAGMYAFDLALTTALPQIRSVKDYIQKYVDDINRMNINSCETAEDLVGGVWPKMQSTQQQLCRDIGSHNGVFSDWAQGRQECGTGGQFKEGIKNAGDRENEVIVNKNLVWAALQNNSMTAQDRELSEMLMSLSGSIIIKMDDSDESKTQKIPLLSVATSQDVIKALMHGGQATFYSCDETKKCLNPRLKAVTVSQTHGLVTQVANLIRELDAQVAADQGNLSTTERGFLEMTPIPVLKYITNSLSLGKSVNPNQFSNLIAISLLNQYFSENIRLVEEFLSQQDTPMNPEMAAQLNQTQALISEALTASYRELVNMDVLVNTMRADEQQLTGRLIRQNLSQ